MNNERRKVLKDCHARLGVIYNLIAEIRTEVEEVRDDEQEAYDNMISSVQEGERGEMSQAAIEAMEGFMEAVDEFCEAIDKVDEAAA